MQGRYILLGAVMLLSGLAICLIALPGTPRVSVPKDPLSIPGRLAWFSADNLAQVDGSRIALWPDSQAGLFSARQPSEENQPALIKNAVAGHAALKFNGTTTYLSSNALAERLASAKGLSAIAVVRALGSAQQYIFCIHAQDKDGDVLRFGFTPRGTMRIKVDPNGKSAKYIEGYEIVTGQWRIYSLVASTQEAVGFVNGKESVRTEAHSPINYARARFFSIGQDYDSGVITDILLGEIAELLLFERPLSAAERKKMELLLAQKYGIAMQ
jgi:hypothetical protein